MRESWNATQRFPLRLASFRTTPLELPFREDLCQQHGFFHAGVTSTIADSAGGYAGFSLFPADASVLTVEFKVNLLAPADGDHLRARGRVIKPGRTLTVTEADVVVIKDGRERTCAHMVQTLMCLRGRPDTVHSVCSSPPP